MKNFLPCLTDSPRNCFLKNNLLKLNQISYQVSSPNWQQNFNCKNLKLNSEMLDSSLCKQKFIFSCSPDLVPGLGKKEFSNLRGLV